MAYHNKLFSCGSNYYGKQAQLGYGPSFPMYDPQTGGSLGTFFSGLVKNVIPYFRSTIMPRILPTAINTAQNILTDTVSGSSFKQAAKTRGLEGIKKIILNNKNNGTSGKKNKKLVINSGVNAGRKTKSVKRKIKSSKPVVVKKRRRINRAKYAF